jgi:hypothetical protein
MNDDAKLLDAMNDCSRRAMQMQRERVVEETKDDEAPMQLNKPDTGTENAHAFHWHAG